MREISKEQLEMELLSGGSVTAGNFKVKSYTLREIVTIGYDFYYERLGYLLFDPSKNKANADKEIAHHYDTDSIFVLSQRLGEEQLKYLIRNVVFFLDTQYHFFVRGGKVFYGDVDEDGLIKEDTVGIFLEEDFQKIKEVLMLQHNLKDVEDESPQLSEGHRRMLELKRKAEEKERKKRGSSGGDEATTLPDIISAVAAKANNLNIINIWDLTIYQFYNVYQRTILVDHYHIQQMALVQGAKITDIRNWTDKI